MNSSGHFEVGFGRTVVYLPVVAHLAPVRPQFPHVVLREAMIVLYEESISLLVTV
jgi:hypothetical protein